MTAKERAQDLIKAAEALFEDAIDLKNQADSKATSAITNVLEAFAAVDGEIERLQEKVTDLEDINDALEDDVADLTYQLEQQAKK